MATPPLSSSLALARARGDDPSSCGFELCRHIVLGVRESKLNRPDLVLKYGTHLIKQHQGALSHEVWAMYEQVVVALLQQGRLGKKGATAPSAAATEAMTSAQEIIGKLNAQFPGSLRVKRLEAMMWEAKGEPELALGEYEEILQEDPSNILALKRQVAVYRSLGRAADAAKRLVAFLDTFCSDPEAWSMLHELYLSQQQYKRAAFCVEELVLINPMAYIYHLRAGEIMYTLGMSPSGSHDQLLTARKYFAHALELKPEGCLRALYGVLLVCAALGASSKGKGIKVDTAELLAHVQPQLVKCYTPAGPNAKPHPMRPLVMALIKKLQAVGEASASKAA